MGNLKNELRKQFIEKRKSITDEDRSLQNTKIFKSIIEYPFYLNSQTVFTYVSMKDEVDTHAIIKHAIANNKKVAVPKVYSNGYMKFFYIKSFNELKPSTMNILEPDDSNEVAIPNNQAIINVPGLVFDHSFNRIGFGGGYYDRYLVAYEMIHKVGLAYDFQITSDIPHDDYDISLNAIISSSKIFTLE